MKQVLWFDTSELIKKIYDHTTVIIIIIRLPVSILGKVLSMFEWKWPHHGLVDSKETDVDDPEEKIEQRPVHVVIITVICQPSVSIFYQHKSELLFIISLKSTYVPFT